MKSRHSLYYKYPPSEPCSCTVCVSFCRRPGWWLVSEARDAMNRGLAGRMMLELSPDRRFGVLSPAFKGNEGFYALKEFSSCGCTFLKDNRCEIFGPDIQPLECRFCRHDRPGAGRSCHLEIERDWNTSKGKRLVRQWVLMSETVLPDRFVSLFR